MCSSWRGWCGFIQTETGHGTGFRGSISGYHRPEYAAVRKADREPHCISDEFFCGPYWRVCTGEFTTRAVLQKYKLGSSANVSIVKRALLKKELIRDGKTSGRHSGSGDGGMVEAGIGFVMPNWEGGCSTRCANESARMDRAIHTG